MENETITIEITQKQTELITQAHRAETEARQRKDLILRSIIAGHDVPDGYTVSTIEGTTLILTAPE